MNLTLAHVEFWQSRQRLPSWVQQIKAKGISPRIDAVVNAHAGLKLTRSEISAHNTLNILRRKRGPLLLDALRRMAIDPCTNIEPRRRSGFCRKWLKRLGHPL